MSEHRQEEQSTELSREEHGGKLSLLAWRSFNALKNFLKKLGFKRIPGTEPVYVFFKRLLRPQGLVLIESHGNRMYADSKDEGVLPLLQKGGIYEEYETGLFKSLISPGDVVIDIGANIGHYTLIAARLVGDDGKIFAFEPDAHNFELLQKNIELNGFTNVTAINKAVSSSAGTVTFYLDRYNLGGHSISADNIYNSAGAVEVETVALDEFLQGAETGGRVNLIKSDTQGAEGFILEGARRTLEEHRPAMLMELWPFGLRNAGYNPEKLIRNLEGLGYGFNVIDKESEDAWQADAAGVIDLCSRLKTQDEHVDLFLQA